MLNPLTISIHAIIMIFELHLILSERRKHHHNVYLFQDKHGTLSVMIKLILS